VTDPGQNNSTLIALAKGQSDAGNDRTERSDLAGRRNNTVLHPANVQALSLAWRVRRGQILAKHCGDRDSHFMTGTCIANHRADDIAFAIQGMDISDGNCFFTGSEPRLGNDSLTHPATQRDVVKTKTEHSGIQVQELITR